MSSKITYEDKEALQNDENILRKNKVTDEDLNEIKQVVNKHATEIEDIQTKQTAQEEELKNLHNYDDTSIKQDIQNIRSDETNLLRGVETVEELTTPATWSNRTWRQASSGTGTRERIDIEDSPNSQFQKGWHIASTNSQVTVAQDNVPTTKNEFYMLSCYAKGTGKVYLQYGSSTVGFQSTQLEVSNEWEKYDFVFKSNGTAGAYFGVNATGYDIEICGLRLEKIDNYLKSEIEENYNELKQKDTEQDNEIEKLEAKNKYLKELNSSLQETVLDGQTEIAETVVENDSSERYWNGKCARWAVSRKKGRI